MARSHWKRIRKREADPRVLNRKVARIERLERVFANHFETDLSQPLSGTAKRQPITTRRYRDVSDFRNKMAPVAGEASKAL